MTAFAPRQEEPAPAPALSEEEQRKARREQALKAQKLVEEDVALQLLAEKEWSKLERAKTRAACPVPIGPAIRLIFYIGLHLVLGKWLGFPLEKIQPT